MTLNCLCCPPRLPCRCSCRTNGPPCDCTIRSLIELLSGPTAIQSEWRSVSHNLPYPILIRSLLQLLPCPVPPSLLSYRIPPAQPLLLLLLYTSSASTLPPLEHPHRPQIGTMAAQVRESLIKIPYLHRCSPVIAYFSVSFQTDPRSNMLYTACFFLRVLFSIFTSTSP